jgi:hypothetical protein
MTDTRIQPGELYKILPNGKWEIYLDATMCGTFGVCEIMFKETFVNNLTPKGDRPFARDLGSWWSAVMEEIYGAFTRGIKLEPQPIMNLAVKNWQELKMDELEKIHPKSYKQFGGFHGAIAMISDYAHRQLPVDYRTWKIIAAEASFGRNREVCIGETDKIILYWMGQPDLFVVYEGRLMPVDHKSIATIDSKTMKKYKPHIQLPGYIIAGQVLCKDLGLDYQVDRCIVNAVARTDSTDKLGNEKRPRFKRFFPQYSTSELEEWKRRRLSQAERIRHCIEYNDWLWNEYACSYQWGHPCQYQNIHEKPPESRLIVVQSDYTTRQPWIPGLKEKKEE